MALVLGTVDPSSKLGAWSYARRDSEVREPSLRTTLRRMDYFTQPSLEELASKGLDSNGNCLVNSFTVGHFTYGSVMFEGPLNVAHLDLDSIVQFRHKEVTVYPDDTAKPPRGEGLNRPAIINLHGVWPTDKSSGQFIRDATVLSSLKYREKLMRACLEMDAEFIDYNAGTGTWTFKVEHFTKYGLDESDEESDLPLLKELLPKTPVVPQAAKGTAERATGLSGLAAVPQRDVTTHEPYPMMTEEDLGLEEDLELEAHRKAALMGEGAVSPPPASVQLARALGMPSQRVQIMKASFFDTDDFAMDTWDAANLPVATATPTLSRILKPSLQSQSALAQEPLKTPLLKLVRPSIAESRAETSLLDVSLKPVVELDPLAGYTRLEPGQTQADKPLKVVPKFAVAEFPVEESFLEGKTGNIADAAMFHGRRFRVGWGPDGSVVSLSSEESYAVRIQQIGPLVQQKRDEDEFTKASANVCTALLAAYFEHGTRRSEQGLPHFTPLPGTQGLEHLRETTFKLREKNIGSVRNELDYMLRVWDLCLALWGPLNEPALEGSHAEIIARREALSRWLQSTSETKYTKLDTVEKILDLLSSRQVSEACRAAQSAGEHRLALLLSQAGSSPVFKSMLQRQLQQWAESKADQFVSHPRMKVFCTLAGTPVWLSSKSTVNTCGNQSWLKAFAHHLWYVCSPVASIADALAEYEKACGLVGDAQAYSAKPKPPYLLSDETADGPLSWDLCYQLLQLYCRRSTALESVLNPLSHTSDLLDNTLSWLLWQQLQAFGYSHLSESAAALLNVSFAAQLEQMGLWHWSVLVHLHSTNPQRHVMDAVGRHIGLEPSHPKETFIRDRLGIPVGLLESQRAVVARTLDLPLQEAKSLLLASMFQEAHDVIFEKLAPEAILAENYQELEELLNPLAEQQRAALIDQWAVRGKVLVDYIKVVKTVEELLGKVREAEKLKKPNWENMTQLEHLTPDLLSLSSQVPLLSTPTSKHKLCKAEIAQRASHILRVVIGLQSGSAADNTVVPSRLLLPQLQQLPVTQDYALKELRNLVRSFLLELRV